MISIEPKPKTYRARVSWYVAVCNWRQGACDYACEIELRDRKKDTIRRAGELGKLYPNCAVSVGWFDPAADPKLALSKTAEYVDYRANPIPHYAKGNA